MIVKIPTYVKMMMCVASLSACTQHHSLMQPQDNQDVFFGSQTLGTRDTFDQEKTVEPSITSELCYEPTNYISGMNYRADELISESSASMTSNPIFHGKLLLSPGDLVALTVENGEGFSGNYIVDSSGYLSIPYIPAIYVIGQSLESISEKIELSLVRSEIFQPSNSLVEISLLQLADIEVTVSGAVFEPGRVQINRKIPAQLMDQRVNALGDHSKERMLSEAIRAASGVRPDAKLDQVILFRKGWQIRVDLRGVFTGNAVNDVALVSGDRIVIPSTGCFQEQLVRPTQITPKGMRIFMSNLVDSAKNNSSAAVGRFSSSVPYGTRLLQAAVSANCIGGMQWTNAPRKVLLASNNPLTGEIQVVERSVEQLIRKANIPNINPYLMPNDAIACYDSDVTNIRDIADTLIDIVSPFKLL